MFRFRWALYVAIVTLLMSSGCGNGGSSGSSGPAIAAPASLTGRTVDAAVNSGSGGFAATGSFRVSFAATTYALQGDGVNTVNSNGTYTYAAVGAVGTATTNDSVIGAGNFAFTYTSATTGTYAANAAAGGVQAGTFVER